MHTSSKGVVALTNKQDLRHWKSICENLPPVRELSVHGTTWANLVAGFAGANLASVRILGLREVSAPSMPIATAEAFNRAFTALTCITLPGSRCFSRTWIAEA